MDTVMKFIKLQTIFFILITSCPSLITGQALDNLTDARQTLPAVINARWISNPDIALTEHNVVYFRKSFSLTSPPATFIIHITADNIYRLYVNGVFAGSGPSRSDRYHWYYETYDLAPLLEPGKNVIAVCVVNFGPRRAFSQFSHLTGLFIQGHTAAESVANTNDADWKTTRDPGYFIHNIEWIDQKDVGGGFYVAPPTDSIVGSLKISGWEDPGFDDSSWISSSWLDNPSIRGTQGAGGIFFPGGWLVYPNPLKILRERRERFASVIKMEGVSTSGKFLRGTGDLVILPAREVTLWIDNKNLDIGFPEMLLSGGKNSLVTFRYAESLFNPDRKTKPDRDDFNNKLFIGIPDFYVPDGSDDQQFRPLSHRAFRFVQIQVRTADQPLTIHDFSFMHTAYPLEQKASFETDDPSLNQLMAPVWRTASLCAQDLLMSDAYYEQMQYVGDSKIHNLAILFMSGNDDLVRNQLRQTDWSRFPDGLTLACYPNDFHLVIPYYSLVWVDMVYDYMIWSGDRKFTRELTWGIENVLHWFNDRLQPTGLLGPVEWWNDMDWSPGFSNGTPPSIGQGNSATLTLQFSISLQNAARIFEWLGDSLKANQYRERSDFILHSVKELCYDPIRGLFAETPQHNFYSQHTNMLAVISGMVTGKESSDIMQKVISDKSLSPCALFFRYYLLDALKECGLGDSIPGQLFPWYDMMKYHLTTFTEIPVTWEGQRSDCHPWATSPNIHFFKSMLGISPVSPGYEKVKIEPSFGNLSFIKGSFPSKIGSVLFDLRKNKQGKVSATINLPEGMSGIFRYGGKEQALIPGGNKFDL